jgi:hypothetical protein
MTVQIINPAHNEKSQRVMLLHEFRPTILFSPKSKRLVQKISTFHWLMLLLFPHSVAA